MPLTKGLDFRPLPGGLPRRRFDGVSGISGAFIVASRSFSVTWPDCSDLVLLCLGESSFSFSPSSSCRFLFDVITEQSLAWIDEPSLISSASYATLEIFTDNR